LVADFGVASEMLESVTVAWKTRVHCSCNHLCLMIFVWLIQFQLQEWSSF